MHARRRTQNESENIGIFLKEMLLILLDAHLGWCKMTWKNGLRNDENPKY